jgi:2-deoxy-D-gluconate 3-dehydrogenase
MQVNFKSVWLLSQAAGRHMVPRRRGKIISFASLLSFQGGLTVPAYASAKGALAQLTKALSNEWAQHNVQVNAIAPGYVATDMCACVDCVCSLAATNSRHVQE